MKRLFPPLLLALALLIGLGAYPAVFADSPQGGDGAGTLTLLHNNDGESSLLPIIYRVNSGGGTVNLPVGSVAAFKTVVDQNISQARASGNAVVNVYAGDAFLASATLLCSQPTAQNPNPPFYDALAQKQIAYDAHIFGNHEFDYSPVFLERFVRAFEVGGALRQPFLSANLDFSGEPGFADMIDADGVYFVGQTDGRVVARSAIMTDTTGLRFGIVGATTPELPTISSPGNVTVTATLTETAAVVQGEVDRLINTYGINKIIFVSHLQNVLNDRQLVQMLRRIDVAVAGGGDELLASTSVPTTTQLLPGEVAPIAGSYPIQETDADGRPIYIVTTAGNYKYVGRLDVQFNAAGDVTSVLGASSYPRRVIPQSTQATQLGLADAVAPDPGIVSSVNDPVTACLTTLASTVVATTTVPLDVSRNSVRSRETNAGNMIADSFLWQYDRLAAQNGLPPRIGTPGGTAQVIAIQNGGGIRQNAGDVLTGTISRLDTYNVLPFDNFMTAVGNVTPADLKTILERSAASLPGEGGQFLQISGLRVAYSHGNAVGNRVLSAVLADGTRIVSNYAVVAGAPSMYIVTNQFTANGGDNYPTLANNPNKTRLLAGGVAISYEQAWREFLESFPNRTVPNIPAYQPGGEGRILIGTQTAVTLGTLATGSAGVEGWILAAGLLGLVAGAALLSRRVRR